MIDTMNDANWIAGLMRENYEAVGFIPEPTVQQRYIYHGNYVFQTDEAGKRIGYILHGPIRYGQPVTISQHVIQYEKRSHGYGLIAFDTLRRRAIQNGASSIRLRVADDLPAVLFWQACGFSCHRVLPGGQARQRLIIEMFLPLALPLIEQLT